MLFPERWAPQGQSESLKMERTDIHAIVLSNLHRLSISVLRPPIGRRYPNFDRCTSQGTQRRRPRIWHWNTGPLTPAKHLGGLVSSASIQSGAEHGRRNVSARLSPWNGIKSFRSHHPPLERPPPLTHQNLQVKVFIICGLKGHRLGLFLKLMPEITGPDHVW